MSECLSPERCPSAVQDPERCPECRSGRLQAFASSRQRSFSVLFSQRTVQPAYSSSASVQFVSQRSVQASVPFRPAFRSGQRSVQASVPVQPAFSQRSVQASVPFRPAFRSGQRSVQASVPFRPAYRSGQRSVQPAFQATPNVSECLSPRRVECFSPRTMSECRSGSRTMSECLSPSDVRVPFRIPERCPSAVQDVSGLRQAAASVPFSQRSVQASVPFRRSVQPAYSFARSPNDVRVRPRNDVRVLFRAATRSSPGCHQVFTKLFGNDVRVLESPKRCPSAVQAPPEYNFASVQFLSCSEPSH
jgi:hypothetical protein